MILTTFRRSIFIPLTFLIILGAVPIASAYYDPGIQRWINRDPIGEDGAVNLFAFVAGNPIGAIDLLGLWKVRDCTATENKTCGDFCALQGKEMVHCERSGRRDYVGQYNEGNKVIIIYNIVIYFNCQCRDKPLPPCVNQNAPPPVIIIQFPRT